MWRSSSNDPILPECLWLKGLKAIDQQECTVCICSDGAFPKEPESVGWSYRHIDPQNIENMCWIQIPGTFTHVEGFYHVLPWLEQAPKRYKSNLSCFLVGYDENLSFGGCYSRVSPAFHQRCSTIFCPLTRFWFHTQKETCSNSRVSQTKIWRNQHQLVVSPLKLELDLSSSSILSAIPMPGCVVWTSA